MRFMRIPERAVHEGAKADMTTYEIANHSWNNSPAESEYLSLESIAVRIMVLLNISTTYLQPISQRQEFLHLEHE
jgi:hypothetical protein